MSLAATITDHWSDTKRIHAIGTLVFSGSYPTGGDGNFTTLIPTGIKSASPPLAVLITGLSGYLYLYNYATGAVMVLDINTGAEIGAGAYPAGVTGDAVTAYTIFRKFR